MVIITESGKITENIYLIDTEQFGNKRITTSFCYWDGCTCYLMDIGTSDNVLTVLRFLKKNEIPLSKVAGIFLSHYHFDHAGGATKLWNRIYKKNPDFKIITTKETKNKLQNADSHVEGAKTTFGDFVGKMEPIPPNLEKEAYRIVKTDEDLDLLLSSDYSIRLISTPGHSIDHCCISLFKDNNLIFCFIGEAAGALYNGSKLRTQPTSMPPNFNFKQYMKSLKKIIELNPKRLGFCHFGVISGEKSVSEYLLGHKNYMEQFREAIIKYYNENQSTRYVIEHLYNDFFNNEYFIDKYYQNISGFSQFFENLRLALTYGIMVDLGYRKPKYEQ